MKGRSEDLENDILLQLLVDVKANDTKAIGKLCDHFLPKVYRFIYYRVKKIEDAEDLTSEVCLRVLQSIQEQKGSFHAWIYRIASNMITDHYRRRAVRSTVESIGDSIEEIDDQSNTAIELLEQQELRQSLSQLTEEQQQVIALKFVEGYGTDEIADLLGKSTGAVRAIQFRALTTMRTLFNEEGQRRNEGKN